MIYREVKRYVYGLYGKPPALIDPEVQKIVPKGYEGGDKPITCRAADILPPELDKAKEATKGIARDIGDVLIYALYPNTGMNFLEWKYAQKVAAPHVPDSVPAVASTATPVAKEEVPPATEVAGEGVEITAAEGEKELTAPMPGIITSFSVILVTNLAESSAPAMNPAVIVKVHSPYFWGARLKKSSDIIGDAEAKR